MSPREKVNILMVDDQPAKLLSLESVLAELDENLIKAGSADEALKHILSNDIAVLLVDVCMPQMDGFELAELVRQHPRFARTAIIFISAVHLTDADRLRGYGLGAVDYIPVPIIPQVLRAKVAVFADLYRKTQELHRLNAELEAHVQELARSNERLLFADRMATIGTLAAGLGHDMGNLLLPVRMHLDSLESGELPTSSREDLQAIRTATEYLRRLAGSLRLLALDPRNMVFANAATDLVDWWHETEGIMRNGVKRHVALSADIPRTLPSVAIDKAALTQVVFNLVQNASDALRDRDDGRVVVSARVVALADTEIVRVSVCDNGAGMSDDAKRRCLEPFFTTKIREFGTGLGLALVVGLVKRAKGAVRIESRPGHGSTFMLDLPIARAAPEVEIAPAARRGVAAVSLSNPRLLAHVRLVLNSLEYEIHTGEPVEADVWVTEASDQSGLDEVHARLVSYPVGRALVFGARHAAYASDDARIVLLDSAAKPSTLHAHIVHALGLEAHETAG